MFPVDYMLLEKFQEGSIIKTRSPTVIDKLSNIIHFSY